MLPEPLHRSQGKSCFVGPETPFVEPLVLIGAAQIGEKAVFFAVKLCYNFAVLKVAALTFKMLSV